MNTHSIANRCAMAAAVFLAAACGTKKAAVETTMQKPAAVETMQERKAASIAFVRRIAENAVETMDVTGPVEFTLEYKGKSVSVPGQLRMRRGEVVRIQLQLPLLGSEVGRLEFTPDYVLVVDRIHREYVKAAYSDLDFLRANGLDYHTLEALFWNRLFIPGHAELSDEDMQRFDVSPQQGNANIPVKLKAGAISYSWIADSKTAAISGAAAAYSSAAHGSSSLTWHYSDFRSVAGKPFPAKQQFTFSTTAAKAAPATVTVAMDEVKTAGGWDARTELPGKYRQVPPGEALAKITGLL